MAQIRKTVSFRADSAPSSGLNTLESDSQQLAVPRTAPVKTRPGILRTSSTTLPTETSINETLQISGHKLSSTSTKRAPNKSTAIAMQHTTMDAADLRLATSHKMHEEVKCLRYEASKIRETLLKVEEEVWS